MDSKLVVGLSQKRREEQLAQGVLQELLGTPRLSGTIRRQTSEHSTEDRNRVTTGATQDWQYYFTEDLELHK